MAEESKSVNNIVSFQKARAAASREPARNLKNLENVAAVAANAEMAQKEVRAYGEALRYLEDHTKEVLVAINRAQKLDKTRVWVRKGDNPFIPPEDFSEVLGVLFPEDVNVNYQPMFNALSAWLRQKGRVPTVGENQTLGEVYLDFTKKADVGHR
jgi:hypothetical protein